MKQIHRIQPSFVYWDATTPRVGGFVSEAAFLRIWIRGTHAKELCGWIAGVELTSPWRLGSKTNNSLQLVRSHWNSLRFELCQKSNSANSNFADLSWLHSSSSDTDSHNSNVPVSNRQFPTGPNQSDCLWTHPKRVGKEFESRGCDCRSLSTSVKYLPQKTCLLCDVPRSVKGGLSIFPGRETPICVLKNRWHKFPSTQHCCCLAPTRHEPDIPLSVWWIQSWDLGLVTGVWSGGQSDPGLSQVCVCVCVLGKRLGFDHTWLNGPGHPRTSSLVVGLPGLHLGLSGDSCLSDQRLDWGKLTPSDWAWSWAISDRIFMTEWLSRVSTRDEQRMRNEHSHGEGAYLFPGSTQVFRTVFCTKQNGFSFVHCGEICFILGQHKMAKNIKLHSSTERKTRFASKTQKSNITQFKRFRWDGNFFSPRLKQIAGDGLRPGRLTITVVILSRRFKYSVSSCLATLSWIYPAQSQENTLELSCWTQEQQKQTNQKLFCGTSRSYEVYRDVPKSCIAGFGTYNQRHPRSLQEVPCRQPAKFVATLHPFTWHRAINQLSLISHPACVQHQTEGISLSPWSGYHFHTGCVMYSVCPGVTDGGSRQGRSTSVAADVSPSVVQEKTKEIRLALDRFDHHPWSAGIPAQVN